MPKGALIENSEGGLVRIVFVAFDRLESILRPVWNDAKYNLNSGKKKIKNFHSPKITVILLQEHQVIKQFNRIDKEY